MVVNMNGIHSDRCHRGAKTTRSWSLLRYATYFLTIICLIILALYLIYMILLSLHPRREITVDYRSLVLMRSQKDLY